MGMQLNAVVQEGELGTDCRQQGEGGSTGDT